MYKYLTNQLKERMLSNGARFTYAGIVSEDKAVINVFIPENFIFGISNLSRNDKHLTLNGRTVSGEWNLTSKGFLFNQEKADADALSLFSYAAREQIGKFFDEMLKEIEE